MQITNNTMYNEELIVKYNKYYLKSYMIKNFIVISLISLGFTIYLLVEEQYIYAGMLIGILGLYFVLTFFMQKMTTKRMLNRSPLVNNPVMQTYVFTEESFIVTNLKTYTVNYEIVQKVAQAEEFYLIQTKDRRTYIIDYKGFENEFDKKELEDFFRSKLNMR